MKLPVRLDAPLCAVPDCGGVLTTSASHPRAGEIRTSLICAACGEMIDGSPEQVAQAVRSEAAYERHLRREEAASARRAKVRRAGGVVVKPVRRARVKVTQGRLFDGGGQR